MRRGARTRVSRIAALEGERAQGKGLATGARVKGEQTETGSRESELPAYGLIALSDWPWAA
jgi:hypothetical protein